MNKRPVRPTDVKDCQTAPKRAPMRFAPAALDSFRVAREVFAEMGR